MSQSVPGYAELEFDLPSALLDSLVRTLDGVEKAPLVSETASSLPEDQGVYQLFYDDIPVYVGKTDAKLGLMNRIVRHSGKILHRLNLDPARVAFKAIRVYVFTAVDIESDLIRHYGGVGGLAWNGSGFGSNDPGRERDTTKNKPGNFDYQYPIDIDRIVDFDLPVSGTAAAALNEIRTKLPYTIRIQRPPGSSRRLHSELEESSVVLSPESMTARSAIDAIIRQLPWGWQATKLLGYIIIYKEDKTYPDAELISRS